MRTTWTLDESKARHFANEYDAAEALVDLPNAHSAFRVVVEVDGEYGICSADAEGRELYLLPDGCAGDVIEDAAQTRLGLPEIVLAVYRELMHQMAMRREDVPPLLRTTMDELQVSIGRVVEATPGTRQQRHEAVHHVFEALIEMHRQTVIADGVVLPEHLNDLLDSI